MAKYLFPLNNHAAHRNTISDIIARFMPNQERVFNGTPCLEWCGGLMDNGYGYVRFHGKTVLTHRFMFEQIVGPIPVDLVLDHLCRNKPCGNILHLEVVTDRVNTLRGIGLAALNARKTHCKRGHEFTNENTYVDKYGQRNCRACGRLKQRDYDLKQKQTDACDRLRGKR